MRRRRGDGHAPAWLGVAFLLAMALCALRFCGAGGPRSRECGAAAGDGSAVVSVGTGGPSAREDHGGAGAVEQPDGLAATTGLRDVTTAQDGVSVFTEEGTVEQVACHLLTSYRDAGDCALAHADYLDLLGRVWCCVVVGDGWSEVCTVWGSSDGDKCEVSVLHLDGQEVGQLFEEGGDDV